ncbi:hypothetical protein [Spirillospora sp. NPDC048819]|uniref:hypothetical protein n=1 Tax=Spirillospora sp. NPDC048819 TaxID=3155268 RepID=UPI0033DE4CDC
MYCSTCGDERVFEQPPCPDGHGGECPERACVECGAAILIGSPPPALAAAPAITTPIAPARDPATAGRAANVRAVA